MSKKEIKTIKFGEHNYYTLLFIVFFLELEVFVHPGYIASRFINDIALVKIEPINCDALSDGAQAVIDLFYFQLELFSFLWKKISDLSHIS